MRIPPKNGMSKEDAARIQSCYDAKQHGAVG